MKNTSHPRNLEDLNLIDDFLISEAMKDKEFCRNVLEVILGVSIKDIHRHEPQKTYYNMPGLRGICLDAYIEDERGTVYDIEMQVRREKNLPHRSRYYQSLMDSELLMQGERDFNKLNNVIIIIITPYDLFGQNRYQYTFENRCAEDSGLALNDGAKRIFLNTHGNNDDQVRPELTQFLKYVEHSIAAVAQQSDNEKILRIHEQVAKLKNDKKVGALFMKSWERDYYIRRDGREEGLKLGREEGIRSWILAMRDSNTPDDAIISSLVKWFDVKAEQAKEYLKKYS